MTRDKKWYVYAKRADFNRLAARFAIDPVTARIIRNRGPVTEEEFDTYLNAGPERLHDGTLLKCAREAAEILLDKIREGRRIRVIGDYDVDGVFSTYILLKCLTHLGAQVDHAIPHRVQDGYGLNIRLIEEAFQDGVDTIVTCDNGISAIEQIRYARSLGMSVILTDHHQPVFIEENGQRQVQLPPADALVDPHVPGDTYPWPQICGAVVAWKVMQLLYDLAGADRAYCDAMLGMAAFATVGDVMPLTGENRIIVKYGLKMLTHTNNIGMQTLIDRTGLTGRDLTAYHIGFVLGPCMNAAGRLSSAEDALSLLLSEDEGEAMELASHLQELNESRKVMTDEGTDKAVSQIASGHMERDKVLVVYLPSCHESVVGIIAGRIRERYDRPVFVLTDHAQAGLIKGSGRSVDAYDMYDGLVRCQDLLTRFGGHPRAAGLTLEKERLGELRRRLNENCSLTEEELTSKLMIDVPVPVSALTMPMIEQLALLEPTGTDNEAPLFAQKDLTILSSKKIGATGTYLKLRLSDGQRTVDALYFGDGPELVRYLQTKYSPEAYDRMCEGRNHSLKLSVAYRPEINEYNGRRSIQIRIVDYR